MINGEIFEDSSTITRLMENLQKTTRIMGTKDLKNTLKNKRRLLHNLKIFKKMFNQLFIDPKELITKEK